MNKKTLYKLSSSALLIALFTQPAFASEAENTKNNSLNIQQSQDELALIKDDDSLSSEEKLKLELDARKKIVMQALSLSMKEIESIEEDFENLPNFEENSIESEIKESFIIELGKFKEYYSEKTALMEESENLNVEDIRGIAREIINYRESIYNPLIGEMIDFNLFFYTKNVIETAGTRLEKIAKDITKLEELNQLEINYFAKDLNKAKQLISEAEILNNLAGEKIFAQEENDEIEEDEKVDSTNEESTERETETNEEEVTKDIDTETNENEEASNDAENSEETESASEATETTNETEESQEEINANTLIIEGLNKIREAYGVFLEISIDLRKLL